MTSAATPNGDELPQVVTPEQTATAFHEAGHAVMALALGRPVQRVSIEPKHLRLGRCELKKGTLRRSKDAIETEVLILLSGLAAEARHQGRYSLAGAAQDLRSVRALLQTRAETQRQIDRLEQRMLDKAEHLLQQPELWLAVEAIAAELLRSTVLSGRAARHLFDQAAARCKVL